MVTADLIGRMGNNMFQIAAAIGYSEKYNVPYEVPKWKYSGCTKIVSVKLANGRVNLGEKGFHYTELPFVEHAKLMGYFQSEKYFKHCEEKIRDLFQFNQQIRDTIHTKYNDILGLATCSIHIRRTDYIGNRFHDVCNPQYYSDAITELESRVKIDRYLIFSDDIPWCKNNFKKGSFIYVENNHDYEDMYLMTQCSNNIICNSSFSWWGAWLNSNKDKIVIAPGKWFGEGSMDTKDLIPEEWIKIEIKQ